MNSMYSTLRGPVEFINRKNLFCIRVGRCWFCWQLVGCSFAKSLSFVKKVRIRGKEDAENILVAVEGY